jgi:fumarate reductase subunit C
MLNVHLYLVQRISAAIMAPLVFIHLGTMIYTIQGGISADEILARTQGSIIWGLFYGLFVLAVSVHAAIGLRVIVFEWLKIQGKALEVLTYAVGILLTGFGFRAVYGVIGS